MIKKFLFIFFVIAGMGTTVTAQVSYSIVYTDSLSFKLKVSIRLSSAKKGPLVFVMPRSVPGAYSVIKYDDFVEGLSALGYGAIDSSERLGSVYLLATGPAASGIGLCSRCVCPDRPASHIHCVDLLDGDIHGRAAIGRQVERRTASVWLSSLVRT